MWNESSSPTLHNCSFLSNRQRGLLNNNASNPTLTDCIFSKNRTFADGAGMGSFDGSHPILINCRFDHNRSGGWGGAYYGTGNPTFLNCKFTRNRTHWAVPALVMNFGWRKGAISQQRDATALRALRSRMASLFTVVLPGSKGIVMSETGKHTRRC